MEADERVLAAFDRLVHDLAVVDPAGLDDGTLHRLVVGVQQRLERLALAAAPAVQTWEARRVWALDGSRSASARLARELRTDQDTCRSVLRRARGLVACPVVAAAGADGSVSGGHIDLLLAASHGGREARFAVDAPVLVEQLAGLGFDDARRLVRYWIARVDDEQAPDPGHPDPVPPAGTGSRLFVSTGLAGSVLVDGELAPVDGAVVATELERLVELIAAEDRRAGHDRTPGERRAAALVAMASRSAALPNGARPARPLFVAHVGEGTVAELCELASGVVVRPRDLAAHADAALLERVLFDDDATILSISRQRRFSGLLRRAIAWRDRHCRHRAGCDVPASRCDVDHVIPWAEGGRTGQHNGRLLCRTHNRHAHLRDADARPRVLRSITRADLERARRRFRTRHGSPEASLFARPSARERARARSTEERRLACARARSLVDPFRTA